jgi:type VI secretion system protein ImpF
MAKTPSDRPLMPSLLDCLLEDDEVPFRSLRGMKLSVRRDLENLFNTRVRNVTWGEDQGELDHSLLNYGLPDFSDVRLSSAIERDKFCRLLEEVIRRHEPRLVNVRVLSLTDSEPVDRTFRFRIEALLRTEPSPEPVTFDSVVRPQTGNVEVQGSG